MSARAAVDGLDHLEGNAAAGATVDEVRGSFHTWLAAHADDLARFRTLPAGLDDQMALLADLQRLLFDGGWLRLGWPPELGGLGGSPVLRGVVSEELAAAGYPPPFSFGMMEVLGPAVARFARADVAASVLPPLLRGEEFWCQGFSEPDAGSDLGSLRLRAEPVEGGFVANGQKVWTSWAQFADRCVLLGRTGTPSDGHRGITAFLVDMATPGVTVRELRAMNGDSEFAELFFDDVFIPAERTLGDVGGGWAVTMHVLSCERGAVAWQRGAWMLRRLEDLVAHLGPSAAHHRARIGQLYAHLYSLRLLSRRTLVQLAADGRAGPSSSVDKVVMAAAEQSLFDAVLDLDAAQLLTDDSPTARTWRSEYFYSRAASIYGGTSEIQRNIIAEHLVGLPRSR